MKRVLHILALLATFTPLSAATANAQTVGTCQRAEAEAFLDVNNVRARIFNSGRLFSAGDEGYEVPKGSGIHATYIVNLWIAGLVRDTIRVAGDNWRHGAFWPGPLDDQGNPPADCAPYDRFYEITHDDLVAYEETGFISNNLADWPWHLGAPVLDGDGDPTNYTLDGGDRPALVGDQMLWWIMNDAGNAHIHPSSLPLGMEVHGTAFAFASDQPRPLGTTTFYRYTLVYKGTAPLKDAYVALFSDNNLGDWGDDFMGSDTTLDLAFIYNNDPYDGDEERPWQRTYGANPPALGYTLLRGPLVKTTEDGPPERLPLTAIMSYIGDHCIICAPDRPQGYYYNMQGLWKDGQPVVMRDEGYPYPTLLPTDSTTRFFYPEDPSTGRPWSAMNLDGKGTRTFVPEPNLSLSTGPFTMQPGDEQEIVFAIVWSLGRDHFDSVRRLRQDVYHLRDRADALLKPLATRTLVDAPVPTRPVLGFAQNFPNPFSQTTTIRYSLPQAMRVRLRVFDVLGRPVAVLVDRRQAEGVYAVDFDARGIAPGVYLARFQADALRFTKTMTVLR